MTLVNIYGDRGSGKTTLASLIALDTPPEVPILADYQLNLPNFVPLRNISEIYRHPGEKLVIIDEAGIKLDCRGSGSSAVNKAASWILYQSRKSRTDFVLTYQLSGSIDLRFDELADYVVLAEAVPDNVHPESFHYTVLKRSETDPDFSEFDLYLEDLKDIFDSKLFDTTQEIMPSPDMIADGIDDKADLLPDALALADELEKLAIKWPKSAVTQYAMKKKIARQVAELAFNELTLRSVLRNG